MVWGVSVATKQVGCSCACKRASTTHTHTHPTQTRAHTHTRARTHAHARTRALAPHTPPQICGSALVLCAEPGRDLTSREYDALDDVVQGPLMGFYEDGAPPSGADWADLARELAESLQGQQALAWRRAGDGCAAASGLRAL